MRNSKTAKEDPQSHHHAAKVRIRYEPVITRQTTTPSMLRVQATPMRNRRKTQAEAATGAITESNACHTHAHGDTQPGAAAAISRGLTHASLCHTYIIL